jgi:murein DD-endopeptidase MepM/ murein hydrolase activator NlpD
MFWKKPENSDSLIKRKPLKSGMTVLVIPDSGESKRLRFRFTWLIAVAVLGLCIGIGAVGAPLLLAASVQTNVSLFAEKTRLQLEKADLERRLGLEQGKVKTLTSRTESFGKRLLDLESRLGAVETRAGVSKLERTSDKPGGGASNLQIADPFKMLETFDAILQSTDGRFQKTLTPLDGTMRREAAVPAGFPTQGRITSKFGSRIGPRTGRLERHTGWDIATNMGAPVRVTAPGVVEVAGWTSMGYGLHIVVSHGYGYKTLYGHLSKIGVNVGDSVSSGELIGLVGSTGNSTGPHLHYEVRLGNTPINPSGFLRRERPKFDSLFEK